MPGRKHRGSPGARFARRSPVLVALVSLGGLAACATGPPGPAASGRIQVVAAENFWGSLAAQLGGDRVRVASIVTDPNADPHEYETSTTDARLFADAGYVVVNGAGYDTWADKLLAANPASSRRVLDVAALFGKKNGDNPHFWYDPGLVSLVVPRISSDYQTIDPGDAAYFRQRLASTEAALQPYQSAISSIRARFAGQRIGATENLFSYMARSLGLDLISPPAFMQAVAEGNDPPADSVRIFENQISGRQMRVLVYNSQTTTRITGNVKAMAASAGIPVVAMTETLSPPGDSFERWQLRELSALSDALASGVGRGG